MNICICPVAPPNAHAKYFFIFVPFTIRLFFFYMYFLARREAVRQRKALSRTSSNILLNSVQMGHHNPHNVNQYHHISYNHPSDCDINAKLKDLKEEDSQESVSNIEVIEFSI